MNLLDKIIVLEANTVTPEDYKSMTGTTLDDLRIRIKKHVENAHKKYDHMDSSK